MQNKFIIDRSKWRCGGHLGASENAVGEGETMLLNEEGFMCCLGQVAKQLGIKDIDLLGAVTPRQLKKPSVEAVRGLLVSEPGSDLNVGELHTALAYSALETNDDPTLTSQDRERALTELFERSGYTLEFTGEYIR